MKKLTALVILLVVVLVGWSWDETSASAIRHEKVSRLEDGGIVKIQYVRGNWVYTDVVKVGNRDDQVKAVFLAEGSADKLLPHLPKREIPAGAPWLTRYKTPKTAAHLTSTGKEKEPRDMHLNCYWVDDVLYCD